MRGILCVAVKKDFYLYVFLEAIIYLFELKKRKINDIACLVDLYNLVDKKFLYNIILVCKRNLFWS